MAEANTVVSLNNLAQCPGLVQSPFPISLECYATAVVYREFPAMRSGNRSPLDDDSALVRLYHDVPFTSRRMSEKRQPRRRSCSNCPTSPVSETPGSERRGSTLPALLWVLVFGGGLVVLTAVAAITFVDRPWPQFAVLGAVTMVFLSAVFLIATLEQPFQASTIQVSDAPMHSALVTVKADLPSNSGRSC